MHLCHSEWHPPGVPSRDGACNSKAGACPADSASTCHSGAVAFMMGSAGSLCSAVSLHLWLTACALRLAQQPHTLGYMKRAAQGSKPSQATSQIGSRRQMIDILGVMRHDTSCLPSHRANFAATRMFESDCHQQTTKCTGVRSCVGGAAPRAQGCCTGWDRPWGF